MCLRQGVFFFRELLSGKGTEHREEWIMFGMDPEKIMYLERKMTGLEEERNELVKLIRDAAAGRSSVRS